MCVQCVQSGSALASFAGTLGAAYGARTVWMAGRSVLSRRRVHTGSVGLTEGLDGPAHASPRAYSAAHQQG